MIKSILLLISIGVFFVFNFELLNITIIFPTPLVSITLKLKIGCPTSPILFQQYFYASLGIRNKATLNLVFNVLMDENNQVADDYKVDLLPVKYIINKNGEIAFINLKHENLVFEIEAARTSL